MCRTFLIQIDDKRMDLLYFNIMGTNYKETTTPPGTIPNLVTDPGTCEPTFTRVSSYTPGTSKVKQSWSIGSMNRKSYQLEEVMTNRRVQIFCVQETKWKILGKKSRFLNTNTKKFKIHYHGLENNRNGVGVILSRKLNDSIISVHKKSDRLMNVKLVLNKSIWNIISAYAPQTGCVDTEKQIFWKECDELLQEIPPEEFVFVGSDLNGHVGKSNQGDKRWHGRYAYGTRNAQGDDMLAFAKAHNLVILNTCFKKQERHLITYSSGGRDSQIDYHLCSRAIKRYANGLQSYPW